MITAFALASAPFRILAMGSAEPRLELAVPVSLRRRRLAGLVEDPCLRCVLGGNCRDPGP